MKKIIKYTGLSLLGILVPISFVFAGVVGCGPIDTPIEFFGLVSIDGIIILLIYNIILFKKRKNKKIPAIIFVLLLTLVTMLYVTGFNPSFLLIKVWPILLIVFLLVFLSYFILLKNNRKLTFIIFMIISNIFIISPLVLYRYMSRVSCTPDQDHRIVPCIPLVNEAGEVVGCQ